MSPIYMTEEQKAAIEKEFKIAQKMTHEYFLTKKKDGQQQYEQRMASMQHIIKEIHLEGDNFTILDATIHLGRTALELISAGSGVQVMAAGYELLSGNDFTTKYPDVHN